MIGEPRVSQHNERLFKLSPQEGATIKEISAKVKIPTIGIGAGKYCDGQVLVTNDMLGLTPGKVPKFVKKYGNVAGEISKAARQYIAEVQSGAFPDDAHSFH